MEEDKVKIIPMTAEERRRVIEAPLTFHEYGRRGHAHGSSKMLEGSSQNYIDDNRDADATERRK
jgi:hypothetical protein